MKNLLLRVDAVVSKYKEVEKITGENFNIFSIMGMKTDEVRTHSAILAELLNPNGSHGLGSEPLELFVKQIYSEDIGLDYKTATCSKEFYAGKINEDYTEGGRIDLLIKDKEETKLVIENKINAPEQKNQLFRYKQRFPNTKLLFLTLDGKESDEKGIEYQTISYKEDILNWMEDCAKLAWNKPMVREVLVHYAHLIKILTKQTINNKMKDEIINIIQSNFEASEEIYRNYETAIGNKQKEYLKDLEVKLSQKVTSDFGVKIDETKKENPLIIQNKAETLKISYRFRGFKDVVTKIIFVGEHSWEKILSRGFIKIQEKDFISFNKVQLNGFNYDYFNEDDKAKAQQEEIVKSLLCYSQELKHLKPKFLYLHGLNSDATSRKYLNLEAYFRDEFIFDCLEWKNDDAISELLDRAEMELENETNPILFGDSTGANFAWQLRERRLKKNQKSILILSSPLLNINQRIADFEFPESLIPYMEVIENPKDSLIIASEKDEIIAMNNLFQSEYEKNFELIKVEDTHRLERFEAYLPQITNYIENQRYLSLSL